MRLLLAHSCHIRHLSCFPCIRHVFRAPAWSSCNAYFPGQSGHGAVQRRKMNYCVPWGTVQAGVYTLRPSLTMASIALCHNATRKQKQWPLQNRREATSMQSPLAAYTQEMCRLTQSDGFRTTRLRHTREDVLWAAVFPDKKPHPGGRIQCAPSMFM